MKCPLARTWANFISHRARRDISQCAVARYFTFCGSKTFHYMHLCLQMQCRSRKKDEEFLKFFVLFLLVAISIFILLYRRYADGCFSFWRCCSIKRGQYRRGARVTSPPRGVDKEDVNQHFRAREQKRAFNKAKNGCASVT